MTIDMVQKYKVLAAESSFQTLFCDVVQATHHLPEPAEKGVGLFNAKKSCRRCTTIFCTESQENTHFDGAT